MKKALIFPLAISVLILSGCGKEDRPLNPLDAGSMVDKFDESKGKINDAVGKEQNKIDDAMKEAGLE